MLKKKNLPDMDILRALAIIIIVLFHWYLFCCQNKDLAALKAVYYANIGLCLFFFVSAYVLYYNYESLESASDIVNFFRKRAKRIYPLYWVAFIVLIFIIDKYFFANSIIGFLGLQGFFPETYYVNTTYLWFIGIIIIYYLIYPILIRPKSLINKFSMAAAIFLIFSLISINFHVVNVKFFLYYWVFFSGIVLCCLNENYKDFKLDYRKLLIESIVLIAILAVLAWILISQPTLINSFPAYLTLIIQMEYIIAVLIIYFVLNMFIEVINRNYKEFFQSKTYGVISKISYSAYATYLLHDIVGTILLYKILFIFNLPTTLNNLLLIIIGLPLVFIIGYYAQKWEIKIINIILQSLQNLSKKIF